MFTVTIDNSQFGRPLTELAKKLGEPAPVLESIGKLLDESARSRALQSIDPDGQPWALWADSTRAAYPFPGTLASKVAGRSGNGRLLDRYGTMFESLNFQVEEDSVVVGYGEPYAVFHEWGTKHMPRRGLLMSDPDQGTLGQADETAVLDLVNHWLDDVLQE